MCVCLSVYVCVRERGGTYLVHNVFQRIGAVDGKADENQVGLGVRKWPETVVFFLSGRVPKSELDGLTGGRVGRIGDVVLENCRDIFLTQCQTRQRLCFPHPQAKCKTKGENFFLTSGKYPWL
jgi:hypothetical protein